MKIKIIFVTIFFGFLLSIAISFFHINTFDKYEGNGNKLIKGSSSVFYSSADDVLTKLKEGKKIFATGDYRASYLPQYSIGIFYFILNEELYIKDKENKKIQPKINNKKEFFFILQSLFYYLALIFFYFKIKKTLGYKYCFLTIFFLCFDPTIIQYHSSFLSESFYFTLTILLMGILWDLPKKVFLNFLVGILLGVMLLQKNVILYFPLFLIFYYLFLFKKNFLKYYLPMILGFSLILLLIGFTHYQKDNSFRIMPSQMKEAHYVYVSHIIFAEANKISRKVGYTKKINDEKNWIKSNNLNLEDSKDKKKLFDYKFNYAKNIMMKYPFTTTKYFLKKTIISLVQDPFLTYKFHKYDLKNIKKLDRKKYYETLFKYFNINIIYSLIFYLLSIFGIYVLFKEKKYQIILLCLLINFYHIALLGWTGASRYMSILLIGSSIFAAYGFGKIFKNNKKILNV